MATILGIETSGKVCSAAVYSNDELLSAAEVHIPQSHASRLAPLIDDLMRHLGIKFSQLEAIAVSSGPGSYTGLRIGVSLTKGLCYSLGIPLIAVNTLELLAFQMRNSVDPDSMLCPMIDARRMEVYCMLTESTLSAFSPVQALVVNENSFNDVLANRNMVFFGDGAGKCSSVIKSKRAIFVDGIYPSAVHLGPLADRKFNHGDFEDLVEFEPSYLKEFFTRKPVSH